ncbi:hypothetical protein LOTGIDRAFT_170786 [Lottia gigantea]|uniref:RH1 domain-containing protein n=1 Tax=Lottia gigantea TaxID=225164 RepID=V4CPR0_LOTGI|nr:hypothetical protein LOTGIDRAFT_170786 [Lottia gigantea]ESP04395.1 hypothetical protein LOTGIDRAFT_170786 [Lottia gigantea]
MSEKVQSLASTVYKEFEKMIQKYDEDVVKELMPLVVGILESLDISYIEKQEIEVELELIRDDNEQLLTQYEREKQLRKASEQKYLEMEDAIEGDKKSMEDKVESMESIIRMLELKARNAADHVTRLEEKESEMKKEYNKLHERYTELFKTHMDYMERTKILMGTDKLAELTGNSPRIKGFQLPNLRPVSMILNSSETPNRGDNSPVTFDITTPSSGKDSNVSIKSELALTGECKVDTSDKDQMTDVINMADGSTTTTNTRLTDTIASIVASTPELDDNSEFNRTNQVANDSGARNRGKNTIYDELAVSSGDMIADVDFGADITGMGKELENLILENTELLATKNALNIVKDDLIAKVDELSGEQEILREEITSLQAVKGRLQLRISTLEEELKKTKEELEKKSQPASTEEEKKKDDDSKEKSDESEKSSLGNDKLSPFNV